MFLKCILVQKVGFLKYKSGLLHVYKIKKKHFAKVYGALILNFGSSLRQMVNVCYSVNMKLRGTKTALEFDRSHPVVQ